MCSVNINLKSKQLTFSEKLTADQIAALSRAKRVIQSDTGAWFVAPGCQWMSALREAELAVRQ